MSQCDAASVPQLSSLNARPDHRFTSLAFRARLLAIVLLVPGSPVPIDKASTEPTDIRRLVGRAQALPPLGDAARENLERQHASWRAELISFDLERRVEARRQPLEQRAIDLAEALRRAKPAPMASQSRKPSSPSGRQGETLDEHATPTRRSPGARSPERRAPSHPPTRESLPRQADGRRGDGPGRAPDRDSTASSGEYYILTRFVVNGTDSCFVCEATRLGRGELLTGGHCVYQLDPNGDGDASDARWAVQAWAWPAGLEPTAALSVGQLAAHQEWIMRGAPEHDVGVVTITAVSPAPGPEGPDPDQ